MLLKTKLATFEYKDTNVNDIISILDSNALFTKKDSISYKFYPNLNHKYKIPISSILILHQNYSSVRIVCYSDLFKPLIITLLCLVLPTLGLMNKVEIVPLICFFFILGLVMLKAMKKSIKQDVEKKLNSLNK